MLTYAQKLAAAQQRSGSWLCVGLDPDPASSPVLAQRGNPVSLRDYILSIIEATHDLVCAFKPNLAFFLAGGSEGICALEEVTGAIPTDIPVVLDAKIGDIGSTQRLYAKAVFETFGVDAVTVNPYVGQDALAPLLDGYPGKAVYVLARTSNPDAPRFQDHPGDSPRVFEQVVNAVRTWAVDYPESTLGLVVGATFTTELEAIRRQAPDTPFLIPGIGAQGGSLLQAVRYGQTAGGLGPLISVSRAILYASKGPDFAVAARQAALQLREEINRFR